MKYILSILILLFTFPGFSQIQDSLPERKFESIFGCTCCSDTIELKSGNKYQFENILIKPECILTVKKKGKVLWRMNLKEEFENELKDKDLTTLCIMDGWKPNRKTILVVAIGAISAEINVKNGKVLRVVKIQ